MVEAEIEGKKEERAERRREGGWRPHCTSWREGALGHVSLQGLLSSLLARGGEKLEEHPPKRVEVSGEVWEVFPLATSTQRPWGTGPWPISSPSCCGSSPRPRRGDARPVGTTVLAEPVWAAGTWVSGLWLLVLLN